MARHRAGRRLAGPVTLALVAAGLLALPAGGRAQEALPPAVAVVVDYARILRDAQAAKGIRSQVESRRNAFQDQFAKVQRLAQQRRRQLDQVHAIALAEVRDSLVEVVGQLAEERGFNLVLPSSSVLLFSPKIDLTDDVLALVDKRLPSVKVPDKVPETPKKN
jgi:outer membrane protein